MVQALVLVGWAGVLLWCGRLHRRLAGLARVSTLDTLTGLPNGRFFESERWPALVRSAAPLAVLFVDLDHLKQNNDRLGRAAGDRYIRRAAEVLRRVCRRGVDEVFRLHTAGDEFAVVLQGAAAESASRIGQAILARLAGAGISASIGIAATRESGREAREALLLQAEQTMRQAKAQGRGRVVMAAALPDSAAASISSQSNDASPRTSQHHDPVARRLDDLFADLAPLLPRHQFGVAADEGLPPLAADEGMLALILLGLVLYGACVSKRVRFVVSQVHRPCTAAGEAPLVELRLKLEGSPPKREPLLLPLCLRACEQCGAAWGFDAEGLYTLWPAASATAWPEATLAEPAGGLAAVSIA
ncbi:MAG: GGDEF domain-containing protein [Polyangia bacterium]